MDTLLANDALSYISLQDLALQLLAAILLSVLLQAHFHRFGSSWTNRNELRVILPAITLTTLLVITVVKSSLALSLGLVGALSIVRFRTPIKEPEELAYLFMAIAIGLGMGANQILPTVIVVLVALAVLTVFRRHVRNQSGDSMHLSLRFGGTQRVMPDQVSELILAHAERVNLHRFISGDEMNEVVYHLEVENAEQLSELGRALAATFEGVEINFVHAPRIPGL